MVAFPKPTRKERKRKPLRRSRSIRKRIPRRIARMTQEEKAERDAWLFWLHQQPCARAGELDCACHDDTQQAHLRDHTGASLKESELRSIPLGAACHEAFDQHKGWALRKFGTKEMGGLERAKAWMLDKIAEYNERFLRRYPEFLKAA